MPTTPTASTGEILVTDTDTGPQYWATSVPLIGGGYMVFLVSDPGNSGAYRITMQRFDNSGNKIGSETLISTDNNTSWPVGAQLADGNVAVTWVSAGGNLLIQRVSNTGSLVGSVVDIGPGPNNPHLLATADGGFIIVAGWNASSGRMYFFDSAANLQTTTITAGDHASATVLQDGSIMVVTDSAGTLSGQLYTSTGIASGNAFAVSQNHTGNAYAQLTTLANGDVVVTWQTNGAGNSNDVAFRILHADGSASTGDIDVVAIAGRQERPSVVALNDGGFLITWEDLAGNDGGGEGILAQRYDASGAAVGLTFTVTATINGDQETDMIPPAQLSDGSVAFSWFGPGTDATDAFTRIFAVDGNPAGPVSITYTGDGGDNTIDGGALADTLSGGDGADIINGGGGSDILNGDAGGDYLDGGTGADTMTGGTGDDTYYVDNAGDTTVEVGGEGNDVVRATISWTLSANTETLILEGSGDIDGTGNTADNFMIGNSGNNTLNGGDGADIIKAGDGNDTVLGGIGNDVLLGQDGNDNMSGQDGNDDLRGGNGADTLDGGIGADILQGGAGSDTLTGGTGADQLDGGSENDSLNGGDGNDVLVGGTGADSMTGGAGDDTYYVDDSGDTTIEAGGEGTDTVHATVNWTLAANTEVLVLDGSGNIDGTGNGGANSLYGNSGDNTLSGDDGNDLIQAGDGADTLNGGAGADILVGGDGADTLNGGTGSDVMTGGTGDDTYYVDSTGDTTVEAGGEGYDTVHSTVNWTLAANTERLVLEGSANLIGFGNALDNTLTGNSGNNTLDGGVGADTMAGGAGDDYYIVDDVGDTTVEVGGEGNDVVYASVSWTLADNIETLVLAGSGSLNGVGNGAANYLVGNSGNNILYGMEGDDLIKAGAGDDTVLGHQGADQILGGDGDDLIDGGTEADRLDGGAGNDGVIGGDGNDILDGGSGNDQVLGGNGADQMNGGLGDDILQGGDGNDVMNGGAGADAMTGGAGDDIFYVDDTGDTVSENGGEGTDTVYATVSFTLGSAVENLVLVDGAGVINGTGNSSANVLTGNDKANTLDGAAGDDVLKGGGGNDTLIGGTGADILVGGTGADIFVVSQASIHISGAIECDTVNDLIKAQGDKIDLSAIDADSGTAADQAFSLVGAFTNHAGEMTLSFSGGFTLLSLDVNGDGRTDYQMRIVGNVTGDSGGWVL